MHRDVKLLPQIARHASRKEWEEACWKIIAKSPDILELFVTSYERHSLVLRAAVMERIRLGKSYREIGNELWLSSQTISGIKKALEKHSYQSYRQRGKTERKKKIYSPATPYSTRKSYRKRIRTKYGSIYVSNRLL